MDCSLHSQNPLLSKSHSPAFVSEATLLSATNEKLLTTSLEVYSTQFSPKIMVPSAMSIQHKRHLDAQANELECKLQDDAQQTQAFALNLGQAVGEKFKAFVDKAKNRATQVFHQQLKGQQ
jgi:hypothetical protein